MTNPFQPPQTLGSPPTALATPAWWNWLAWLYPFALVGSFYLTWFSAQLTLGRPPTPFIDDPSDCGFSVGFFCWATFILLMAFPIAIVFGIGLQLFRSGTGWPKRVSLASLLGLVWFAAIGFLRWDPYDVVTWFFD